MKKIIVQQFMTADGFAAEADGGMNFQQNYVAQNDRSFQEDGMRFFDTIDTMILGANTYQMFVQYWPYAAEDVGELAEKLNSLSKYVVSSKLEHAPWGEWEDAKIIKENPGEEIAKLKRQPGSDIVIWGSLQLCRSLVKQGLIDEYQLRVCPAAIGSGLGIFPENGSNLNLKLIEAKAYDEGMVLLRYKPKRN